MRERFAEVMTKKRRLMTAIDVGTTKVATAIARFGDGEAELLGMGVCRSKGLRRGVIVNLLETVECVKASLEEAEKGAGSVTESAVVTVGGAYVRGLNITGVTEVRGRGGEITPDDVRRAVKQATAFKPPENSQLIHVLKRSFRVDGQEGISDPIGMGGNDLAIQLHLVLNASTVVNNIVSAINKAGVVVDSVVMQQMASAEATLSQDEKELGAAVVDVGGGTVDIAVYKMGSICHTESLPMGGNQITNDIAIGLKTSLAQAERLKCRQAETTFDDSREDELIDLIEVSSGRQRLLSRRLLSQIAQARTDEILRSVARNGNGEDESESMSGVILTGGGAHLKGFRRRAEEILKMPVRVGLPTNVVSWKDSAAVPQNCAVLGLIQYARGIQADDTAGFSAPDALLKARRSPGRVSNWIRARIG